MGTYGPVMEDEAHSVDGERTERSTGGAGVHGTYGTCEGGGSAKEAIQRNATTATGASSSDLVHGSSLADGNGGVGVGGSLGNEVLHHFVTESTEEIHDKDSLPAKVGSALASVRDTFSSGLASVKDAVSEASGLGATRHVQSPEQHASQWLPPSNSTASMQPSGGEDVHMEHDEVSLAQSMDRLTTGSSSIDRAFGSGLPRRSKM